MKLEELEVDNLSIDVAEKVWDIANKWNYFEKDTIGKQLVRAVDSISANFSESFGRYHFKEKLNFSYFSRGSLFETKTWLTKSKNRKLITEEEFKYFQDNLNTISLKLNNYIKITRKQIT